MKLKLLKEINIEKKMYSLWCNLFEITFFLNNKLFLLTFYYIILFKS